MPLRDGSPHHYYAAAQDREQTETSQSVRLGTLAGEEEEDDSGECRLLVYRAPDGSKTTLLDARGGQSVERLTAALDGLPQQERVFMKLVHLEMMSLDELAQALSLTPREVVLLEASAILHLKQRLHP